MTLLGAVYVQGVIVFGADRRTLRKDLQGSEWPWTHLDKVTATSEATPGLMWGWAGDQRVADKLHPWIEGADKSDWSEFRDGLSVAVRVFNQPEHLASTECLIAGYVGTTPGILLVDSRGDCSWVVDATPEVRPCFTGVSSVGVAIAWSVLTALHPDDETSEGFQNFMRAVIENQRHALEGFAAWEITPEGNERVICED
jgi:hypothetical protein